MVNLTISVPSTRCLSAKSRGGPFAGLPLPEDANLFCFVTELIAKPPLGHHQALVVAVDFVIEPVQ